ncbi:MAG: class I SAM-dependent methyltransferase [Candidatus Aminicenantes bacterium]|nr:MAG: class I SAM-dependent methyltransferase [Candidatus Aminicenantes bacterium]
MKIDNLYKRCYLNKKGWIDGTSQFKKMVESHLNNELEILDLGAGSGDSQHKYKGCVRKVVGVDISEEVLTNSNLDEAYQCCVTNMPFEDNRFDVAFADYLIEHLGEPTKAAREIHRVLKPGGVLIIRTPNLRHYVVLISRITPHWFHTFLCKKLQSKHKEDTFETYYRCNTPHRIKQVFEKYGFTLKHFEMVEKEPSYLMKWCWTFVIGLFYERLVNSAKWFEGFRANIFAVFRKPS